MLRLTMMCLVLGHPAAASAQEITGQDVDKILERADRLLEEAKAGYEDARSKSSVSAFVDAGFKLEEARIKYLVVQEVGAADKQKLAADRMRAVNQLSKLIHDGKVAIAGTPGEKSSAAPPSAPLNPSSPPPPEIRGLSGAYFSNRDLVDPPVHVRVDSSIDFSQGTGAWTGPPAPDLGSENFSVRWTGYLLPPETGDYRFYTNTDDGVRLWVGGRLVIDKWVPQYPTEYTATFSLKAGERCELRMEYYQGQGGAVASLKWSGPSIPKQVIPPDRLLPALFAKPSMGAQPAAAPDSPKMAKASDVSKRVPVPDAARQREAEKQIKDIFKDQYSKKAAADRKALVRLLLDQAAKSLDDPTALWVLCKEAQDQAVQIGDAPSVLESIDLAARLFDIDAAAMKYAALGVAAKAAKTPEDLTQLMDPLYWLIDEFVRADQFDAADKAASLAVQSARRMNDVVVIDRATARSKEVAEARTLYQAMKSVLQAQVRNPDDPRANLEIGRFLCFVKGSWDLGLRFMVKGADAALKALSAQELAFPLQPADRAALADGWYGLAEKEKSPLRKSQLMAHAKAVYESALPDATALLRARIEKRLDEIDSAEGAKAALTLDLGGGVRMELIYIKPGAFIMGGTEAPGTDAWWVDERPEHRVTITKGFYLGKYEVTQAQWEAVMGTSPSKWKGPELPVEQVSWDDCQGFMKKLNEKAKNSLKGRLAGLPTEAEWEYAARAGTKMRWSFGQQEAGIGDHAWYSGNSGSQTHAVGKKRPNAWGLYDMQGNVWEWCQDWAGPYTKDEVDPTGPASGARRCLRGGCCSDGATICRVAFRFRYPTDARNPGVGFRVCLK